MSGGVTPWRSQTVSVDTNQKLCYGDTSFMFLFNVGFCSVPWHWLETSYIFLFNVGFWSVPWIEGRQTASKTSWFTKRSIRSYVYLLGRVAHWPAQFSGFGNALGHPLYTIMRSASWMGNGEWAGNILWNLDLNILYITIFIVTLAWCIYSWSLKIIYGTKYQIMAYLVQTNQVIHKHSNTRKSNGSIYKQVKIISTSLQTKRFEREQESRSPLGYFEDWGSIDVVDDPHSQNSTSSRLWPRQSESKDQFRASSMTISQKGWEASGIVFLLLEYCVV